MEVIRPPESTQQTRSMHCNLFLFVAEFACFAYALLSTVLNWKNIGAIKPFGRRDTTGTGPVPLITEEQINIIFSNIVEILNMNQVLK